MAQFKVDALRAAFFKVDKAGGSLSICLAAANLGMDHVCHFLTAPRSYESLSHGSADVIGTLVLSPERAEHVVTSVIVFANMALTL
jgi:hypothetical protein